MRPKRPPKTGDLVQVSEGLAHSGNVFARKMAGKYGLFLERSSHAERGFVVFPDNTSRWFELRNLQVIETR